MEKFTKEKAILIVKEGGYAEHYPQIEAFHVCADGNVFLPFNASEARAHCNSKGLELVIVSKGDLNAVVEEEEAEIVTGKGSVLEISPEGIAEVSEATVEKGAVLEISPEGIAEVSEEATVEKGAVLEISPEGITEVSEEATVEKGAILEISPEGITEVSEEASPEKLEEVKPTKKGK